MDRSIFLARTLRPTFIAIALGMLINLGMYESMIAEVLRPGHQQQQRNGHSANH